MNALKPALLLGVLTGLLVGLGYMIGGSSVALFALIIAGIMNFVAYWFIGIPVGYFLCFRLGWGALGIWIGLCVGLMIIGSALLIAWHRRVFSVGCRAR